MEIRLTRDNKAVLDDWAEEFQSGAVRPKRKRLLNGIIHVYHYGPRTLLEQIDFSKLPKIPTSKKYDLRKETEEILSKLLKRVREKTKLDLDEQNLVNQLIEHSATRRDELRESLKNFIVDDIKQDPRQICLDLPVELVERSKKVLAKSRRKQNLNDYLAAQLSLALDGKDENELQEEVEQLAHQKHVQSPAPGKQLLVFTVLIVDKETKRKLSRIGRPRFEESVELLLNRSILPVSV
jgi:hypothetical protein